MSITFGAYSQSMDVVTDAAHDSSAQTIPEVKKENILTRKTLTNNWGGLGLKAQQAGITIKASLTSFEQGLMAGNYGSKGYGNKEWRLGSRLMSTVMFNGEKLGLWKGFFAVGRFDYNMGHSVNNYGGTLYPVNTGLAYPGTLGNQRFGSSAYLIQFLSPTKKIFIGKLSMLDLTALSGIKGGEGTTTFQNVCFLTSPNGISTPSVFGGFFVSESKPVDYTVAVYGANSALNNWNIYRGFSDGITVYASADIPFKIAGLNGKQGLFGVYSNKTMYDLSDIPNSFDFNKITIPSVKGKRYSYGYYFTQDVYQCSTNKKKVITLFGQAVITDKQTTPNDWGILGGIGGANPFRVVDRWGIAGFEYSFLNNLEGLPTILAFPGKLQSSESGIEVFYDCQLLPWFSVGGNFQWIEPGTQTKNATFLGFRSRINF